MDQTIDLRPNNPSVINTLIRRGVVDGANAFAGPEHVVIDLTNRCNNNCIACWTKSPLLQNNTTDSEWHRQQLATKTAEQVIDDLARLGTDIIRFTGGGEPFLHPDIFELIARVKSHKMYCAVTTSLNMLNAEDAERLVQSGVDELSVSLWAATPEDYVKTHPNKKADVFHRITQVLESIARLKGKKNIFSLFSRNTSKKPKINILNVISRLNCSNIEQMYEYAQKVNAESIYFAVVDTIAGSTDSLLLSTADRSLVLNACDRIEEKNRSLRKNKQIHLDNFTGFKERVLADGAESGDYDSGHIDSIPCYIGWIFARIMANGEVAPCCRGVQLPMGNLNNESFDKIWFSERYNRFRRMAKKESKQHKYFQVIGCGKTCDNFMHNQELHHRFFG